MRMNIFFIIDVIIIDGCDYCICKCNHDSIDDIDLSVYEYVCIFIKGRAGLTDPPIVIGHIFVVSKSNSPVMTRIHTSLVHHNPHQPILPIPKNLHLLIDNRIIIFNLLLIDSSKPIQMRNKYGWIFLNMQLFPSQSHPITFLTIPSILLI